MSRLTENSVFLGSNLEPLTGAVLANSLRKILGTTLGPDEVLARSAAYLNALKVGATFTLAVPHQTNRYLFCPTPYQQCEVLQINGRDLFEFEHGNYREVGSLDMTLENLVRVYICQLDIRKARHVTTEIYGKRSRAAFEMTGNGVFPFQLGELAALPQEESSLATFPQTSELLEEWRASQLGQRGNLYSGGSLVSKLASSPVRRNLGDPRKLCNVSEWDVRLAVPRDQVFNRDLLQEVSEQTGLALRCLRYSGCFGSTIPVAQFSGWKIIDPDLLLEVDFTILPQGFPEIAEHWKHLFTAEEIRWQRLCRQALRANGAPESIILALKHWQVDRALERFAAKIETQQISPQPTTENLRWLLGEPCPMLPIEVRLYLPIELHSSPAGTQ